MQMSFVDFRMIHCEKRANGSSLHCNDSSHIFYFKDKQNVKVKPGYYFRKVDDHNIADDIDYHACDWLYIKRNNEVQFFSTWYGEHCLYPLVYETSPHLIYQNIKRNKSKFSKLICECNKDFGFPEFRNVQFTKVSDSSLFHKTPLDTLYFTEEISFVKNGAILKMTNTRGEVFVDTYEFAGR